MNFNKKIKYVFIVLLSIMAAMILHSLTSAYSTIPQNHEWSCLVDKFGLIAVVSVWYIIAFGCISYIFYKYEHKIPGNSCEKGIRYGAAVSILWLWGMLEGVSLFGNSIIDELITGTYVMLFQYFSWDYCLGNILLKEIILIVQRNLSITVSN